MLMDIGFLIKNENNSLSSLEDLEHKENLAEEYADSSLAPVHFEQAWQQVLNYLSKKLRKPSFETWIRPSKLINIEKGFAVISVKNEFTRNFISQSFVDVIQEALKEVLKTSLGLRIIIDETISYQTSTSLEVEQSSFAELSHKISKTKLNNSGLLHEKLFSDCFLGAHNQMPFSFARAILDKKTTLYKYLYVYSPSGLGKTYFLNAIGNEAKSNNQEVFYVKAEDFTNQFISSLRSSKSESFREKFRKLDLLLFDDFEFMDNKKSSQEELAHTIDSISTRGGRVVIASNKSISEFQKLHSSLLAKLNTALQAEIHNPDLQAKYEIVSRLARERSLDISESHKELISRKYSKISQIEQALNQLSALQEYSNYDIDDELIARLFGSVHPVSENQGLSIEIIAKEVSDFFKISLSEIRSKRRLQSLVRARHLAIYLSYELLDLSYSSIGEYFGARRHSSVIHSIRNIREELALNNAIQIPESRSTKTIIEEIKRRIKEKLGRI
jgi:chromosomal replication initiator protein